ncbi:MAG: hypothetical protein HY512_01935 [Candidatus Aenigmarchaeota archaeon]|nr:hypothetical protein [Candidatus Aenigmarchaeota archaeon]
MRVRDLKNQLNLMIPEFKVNDQMTAVAHWLNKIHMSPKGEYITSSEKEIKTLEKLKGLKLVDFEGSGEIKVKLSETGKKLHTDFQAHGYFNK